MKHSISAILLLLTLSSEQILSNPVSGSHSLVVSSTESTKESEDSKHDPTNVNPQIYAMDIQTNISNRFATTLITSKVRNLEQKAAETTFSVILPENAFISQFTMEIDGKIYKAYVKEKEEAKKIYEEARARGESAGHVELNPRDSKTFTVSVNIEPESKTIFRLTYEELLQRQLGQYELVVNIHPGQIVDDLNVEVQIKESRPLTFVNTPALRTGNEISKNDDAGLDPSTDIQVINETSAIIKFKPDKNQQKNFAKLLGSKTEDGLAGQFIVQYDVERDPQGGEVLVRDGYFVHFFSPAELEPLQKHVVFVLDHSGSMIGRNIEQLTEAMQHILPQLNKNDLFSIVRFNEAASVWNVTGDKFTTVNDFDTRNYEKLRAQLSELSLPEGVAATKENIEKGKNIVKNHGDMGLTNIIAGLEVGLFLLKRTEEKFPKQYQPMIIFLTDGYPNVDMSSGDEITETVTKINSGDIRASIFSLSFGDGADKNFLQKLSSKNLGFSRHIFEASDASLQLQDFYRKISSPLLSNVTFKYVDGVSNVTQTHYPILFNGSELVVAGRTDNNSNISLHVHGICRRGPIDFKPIRAEPISSLERLWAYLTVKQILKERETATNKTELTKKALDLALKYSFVTDVSSLVVVKPNRTDDVDSKLTAPDEGRPSWKRAPLPGGSIPPLKLSGPTGQRPVPYSGFLRFSSGSAMSGYPVQHSLMNIRPSYSSFGGSFHNRGGIMMPGLPAGPSYSQQPTPLWVPGPLPPQGPQGMPLPPPRAYPVPPTTTVAPPTSSTISQSTSEAPQWLEDIRNNNQNITTAQGSFILGKSGDASVHPECPQTPLNGTGTCTLLFDCPQVFSILTDINVYLQYFCPLNEFAGVCCPKKTTGNY